MPQRLALCSGAVLAGARSLARKAASQMWMNVDHTMVVVNTGV